MLSRFPIFRRPLTLGRYETAASLLSRHAAQLGNFGVAAMCRDFGVPWSAILSGEAERLGDLANAAEVSHDALLAWSPTHTPDGVQIGREILPKTVQSQRPMRVCPLCLRDDLQSSQGRPDVAVFGRAHWHIACLPICEIHGVELVEPGTDPARQTQSDFALWVRPVLRDLTGWICKAVPCTPSPCDTYLFARLRGDAPSVPLLDGLSLPDAAGACQVLGLDAVVAEGSTTMTDVSGLQLARGRGYDLLAAGPAELTRFFDDRLKRIGPDNLVGLPLTAAYGRFHRWLTGRSQTGLDPIRNAIVEHAFANLPLSAGTKVCGRVLPAQRRFTIRTACGHSYARTATMRTWLIAEGVLSGALTEVGDATVLPETPAATAFFHTARNAVTHRQASSLLKIDADRFNELLAADIVRPIFSTITDPTQNAYDRTELDALLHRLIAGRRIGLAEGDDDIAYAVLARVATQARCTFPDVVHLLLADPTVETYCKPNEIGLRALYVSIEAVRTAIHGPRLPGLTPWRFVKTLNITRHDFVALRDMGLIRIERVPHPALNAPFAIVPRASVNDFRRRFIALQAVANRMGRHWLTARRRLNAACLEPVYEGTTPWSWFYERTPVLECLFGPGLNKPP